MFMQRFFYLVIVGFSFFSIFPALAHGAQANFSWLPNTEETLAGYEIHYGTSSENYTTVIDVGLPEPIDGRVHATVVDLDEGNTYYFAAIAYDSNGIESDFSEEVSYTVTPSEPSLPPVANDLAVDTTEDTPVTDQLRVDNSGGLPLQYTVISAISPGTLTLEDATGSFTYTPAPDFNGSDSFTFTATNDNGESNIAVVEIVINPANDSPVALNGIITTDEDITVNGQLEAEDPDDDYLSHVLVTAPTQGAAEVDSNGSFIYTPAANSSGTDSFSFKVNDGSVDSAPATVTITINSVNDAPVAHPAAFITQEETVKSGQLTADDPDGDTLTFTMTTSPAQGMASVNSNGSFTYTPAVNSSGTDSFSYTVNDDFVNSTPATVTITVNSVNDAPVADPATFTIQEDTVVSGQLTANDPDGNTLTYTMVTNPAQGMASLNSSGSFTYTPAANSSGTDSFSYTVNDGFVNSAPATVTITVNPVNDAPVAENSAITVEADTETSGWLNATDAEGEPLIYLLTSSSGLGTVTISPDGAFTYTANHTGSGNDSFTFQADDGTNTSNIATVSITINQADNPLRFEIGELQVSSDWQVVHFDASFANPVVVVNASSLNDVEPGVVRVKNVTANGFEVRFQEWDYLDDSHPEEIITFLVMEQGHFTLDDGSEVEADCFPISGASSFSTVSFNQTMAVPPVVQTSITTYNEDDAVTTRVRNISISEFDFMMREQENNAASHGSETVCYIAWEPSRGELAEMSYDVAVTGDEVTHNPYKTNYGQQFTEVPMVLAGMQSTDGGDTTVVRISENTFTDATIFLSEEQSKDSETNHTTETVGYIAIGSYDPLGDPDNDGLTTEQELNTYKTNPGLADTDNDGLDDGEEVNYWQDRGIDWAADLDNDGLSNILDQDADGDGMVDGAEIAAGYDPADPASSQNFPIIEAGEVDVDHNWVHVNFTRSFATPVVIAKMISKNDAEPCLVRIDSISSTGFDLRLQEYDYLDDIHPVEQVSFIVMEAGHYTLDGTQLEAGTTTVQATSGYDQLNFSGEFSATPVVITSIGSENKQNGVTTRIRKINPTGFECKLQEQELTKNNHIPETVNYLAWEPSSGLAGNIRYEVATTGDRVTHEVTTVEFSSSFNQTPLVVTDMQTTDGGDTSALRTLQVSSLDLQVTVEEEQSKDSEIRHTSEDAGFIAILSE